MSSQTIREPERRTPILKRTQVLVVGGGSAGVSAAVAAARAGVEVTLVERYGSLGGLATGGLVALLLTLDDGRGRQVIGGLCQELTERMTSAGGAFHPPAEEWGSDDAELVAEYFRWGLVWGGSGAHHRVRYAVAFDPEVMRQVLAELVQEAGVDLLYHMWAADAIVEGERVRGVTFQSKAGPSAGCAFELERIHPWLWFRMGGVSDVAAALEAGAGFFRTPNPGVVLLPWGSVARIERKIDPTDPRDLTYAELECRRMVMEEVHRLKQTVPEMAQAHICNIATQLGITESRRLVGRYVLTRDDMDTSFDDAVCITGHWTKYGVVYAIPYRCLQTRELVNLLAAGRIISVDHRVHHATKEIPACMAVGQAAGAAAALALDRDGDVRAVDAALLRGRLVAGGALLDYFS